MKVGLTRARLGSHANELSFSRVVAVTAYGEQAARSVVVDADESAQTVTATFAQRLPVGPCMLRYFFEGTLNDKMAGFYRSSYGVQLLLISSFRRH